ncbi:MAG: HupE/UreJ family protein [Pseudomonadota bacterium]
MTSRFLVVPWLLMLELLMLASSAQAHLLPKQNATMNIVDNAAFFVVSVPVSALKDVDDDGNGKLTAQEIQRHDRSIKQQFADRFTVTNEGEGGTSVLSWIMAPDGGGGQMASDHIVIMHRMNFPAVPENPVLMTDLFGTGPDEQQMTVKATLDGVSEVAILRPDVTAHQFFRGGWSIFLDYIRIGSEHILIGADHLLFLLTIIIAGAGWRYWVSVVTSFTVAHSITLTVSALDIFRISPDIVEPAIAASIVLMALFNLAYRNRNVAAIGWTRIGVIFACGLIHGFGFGSAIGAMTNNAGNLVATLAGFNIGIELGQFLFLGGLLLLVAICRKFGNVKIAERAPQFASITAITFGFILLAQRIAAV